MNSLSQYIMEKFKISKDIDNTDNIIKYFLDIDIFDPSNNSMHGDMGYFTEEMNNVYYTSIESLLLEIEEHVDYYIESYGDSDEDFGIPIFSIQVREYDTKKLEDEDIDEYNFGDDYLNSEIENKRKNIEGYILKEYLDKTKKYWKSYTNESDILKNINKNMAVKVSVL